MLRLLHWSGQLRSPGSYRRPLLVPPYHSPWTEADRPVRLSVPVSPRGPLCIGPTDLPQSREAAGSGRTCSSVSSTHLLSRQAVQRNQRNKCRICNHLFGTSYIPTQLFTQEHCSADSARTFSASHLHLKFCPSIKCDGLVAAVPKVAPDHYRGWTGGTSPLTHCWTVPP